MIYAGILSDTHLSLATHQFKMLAKRAFSHCDVIFHAGDLTNNSLLTVFQNQTVYAVHGNMCDNTTSQSLPESRATTIEGYTICLCHGAGPRHNIEDRMWSRFPDADCIIFGHTHQPVVEKKGGILFINPGSFQNSSSHGSPASYAILTIEKTGLTAKLHTIVLNQ